VSRTFSHFTGGPSDLQRDDIPTVLP
jgi:hypothetical protein